MAALQGWAGGAPSGEPVISVNCGGYLLLRHARGYEGPFPLLDDEA
jgi:hypothetical protein